MLEGTSVIITQRAEARGVLRADLRVGAELSWIDSASGGIWLAFGPEDLEARLAAANEPLPSQARIARIRAEGVSIGGGGVTLPDISALAVPVTDGRGRCLASLSITAPAARFDPSRYLPKLGHAAAELAALGGMI